MINNGIIIAFTFGYLALLFAIAWFSEKASVKGRHLSNHPFIYALSLAVYCTAWTYYGSVGRASTNGMEFLTIFIGPSLIAPLWWIIMRKIIRISKIQQISSIADFISSRYGKNITLGGIVTVFSLLGIIPYISLQIKAVATSFETLRTLDATPLIEAVPFFQDTAFYLSLGLALFTILFGTRKIEATAQHEGMVMAIAFESIFKLFAFLAVGLFVTYYIFDGFSDIFTQSTAQGLDHLFLLNSGGAGTSDWFYMSVLSMMAILFLPRQFQMGVIENNNEKHLDTAMWLFPFYLLLINIFVLPIALGGLIHFPTGSVDADIFVLALPISFKQEWLALLVFLGGFSAATSMIIVSAVALSTMVSNNLVMPLLLINENFQKRYQHRLSSVLIWTRRIAILCIIITAYIYYREISAKFSLVSIGLISFVAIAQFTPAIIGGIYWKKATRVGALMGIAAGFMIWFYTLVLPTIVTSGYLPEDIMTVGPFGISILKPYALLGFESMDFVSHGLFFSLSTNLLLFATFSLLSVQSSKEHNQAVIFVDIFKYSTILDTSIVWKGQAYLPDLKSLLHNFLGESKTKSMLDDFFRKRNKNIGASEYADAELVNFAERLLSGIIGAASARIMVGSVVKEEEISMNEVLGILKETQELKLLNEKLKIKTSELKKASDKLKNLNERLLLNDELKDEFISTVTHEMKTPITSIRAFSEILLDEDLPEEERKKFLDIIIKETKRMNRLIDQVLDIEKFDSGKQKLNLIETDIRIMILQASDSVHHLFKERGIAYNINIDLPEATIELDEDRIKQVLLNLLSNALKFARGYVELNAFWQNGTIHIQVMDDGPGISDDERAFIFDKFFQAKNQTQKKPVGSGLGLAISKKIIEYHGGTINVERKDSRTVFFFTLPVHPKITLAEKANSYDA
ncbi:sensor histidine kinase [Anditalea andensis]|uniref:histidine kinase n=1 Tax=Anditalea andensis TaxID=1048983 RepID=A0A074LIG2_9BACT|nr:sensor histidine kinase [Anditalea andensis]KEO73562.1 histidine kinase [Anditalea andensis]